MFTQGEAFTFGYAVGFVLGFIYNIALRRIRKGV